MKRFSLILLASVLTATLVQAQRGSTPPATQNGQNPKGQPSSRKPKELPKATDYAVTERGEHHRVWQKVSLLTNLVGEVSVRTNSYTELGTGMHYWENGQWKESQEEIEILPNNAGAAASKGQHKVIFPPDIYDGQIEMQTPDGKWLRSRVLGLVYFDMANSQSVLIAETTNSIGEVHGNNVVIYPDAFTDIRADVRLTYNKSGFEQDIILRARIPSPMEYGLNPRTTRLQVLTEFFDPPQPSKRKQTTTDSTGATMADELLEFGVTRMGRGKAFSLVLDSDRAVPVAKQWLKLEGRSFLIEEVNVREVQDELNALPQGASLQNGSRANKLAKVGRTVLPEQRQAARKTGGKPMRMAQSSPANKGFVLDYTTINGTTNDYTFRGDTTYYVSGDFYIEATTTFEGGAVLKYDGGGTVYCLGAVDCDTNLYQPVILTTMDDDSVGEAITGSTGDPDIVVVTGVFLSGSDAYSIKNFSVRYLYQGFVVDAYTSSVEIKDSQFVHCGFAVPVNIHEITFRNLLFSQCDAVIIPDGGDLTLHGEHLTVDHCESIILDSEANYQVNLTNSILTYVTDINDAVLQNCVWTSVAGVYQAVGAGDYYLATNSPYRDAGTTNINATLLTANHQMTTYPPPQSTLDANPPDLGFHYPALTDWDLDGMEDGWEFQYFGDLTRTGSGDYDGDGLTDLQEYQQGTNPTSQDSDSDGVIDQLFKVFITRPASSTQIP